VHSATVFVSTMKTHYPFLDYAWIKLWVLVIVAVHANEVVKFIRSLT